MRTKANRQHRVPLSTPALEILDAARTLGERAGPPVFTRGHGKPLDYKQLCCPLRAHGIAAVPQGFRSSFPDWAAEEPDHPREVIEAALEHVVQNRVEADSKHADTHHNSRNGAHGGVCWSIDDMNTLLLKPEHRYCAR